MKKKRIPPTWTTADGRVVLIAELGDKHLVNILRMIELNLKGAPTKSGMLPETHVKQYNILVREALSRGLFIWETDRKYVKANVAQSKQYIKKIPMTGLPVHRLAPRPYRYRSGLEDED